MVAGGLVGAGVVEAEEGEDGVKGSVWKKADREKPQPAGPAGVVVDDDGEPSVPVFAIGEPRKRLTPITCPAPSPPSQPLLVSVDAAKHNRDCPQQQRRSQHI